MNRRSFFQILGGAAATPPAVTASETEWSFVHFTDPHIQPELRAEEGCRLGFRHIMRRQPEFVVCGGDLAFDTLATGRQRADTLFRMYREAAKVIEVPLYNTIGNHDVFGLYTASGVQPSEPGYGKRKYEDYFGRRYYSFHHRGWHFISLDSIGMTPDRQYIGHIDDDQFSWLKADLEATGPSTPIVVITHIPLLTTFSHIVSPAGASTATTIVTNTREVLALLSAYNVKVVLQGHTHVCETVRYKNTEFITSGALSGNWWRGKRLGFDEGFAVLTVRGNTVTWRYETYGWKAEA